MLPAGEGTRGTQSSTLSSVKPYRGLCGKCGARRIDSQLGLEATPALYVAHMVEVFREVRRVLRGDGTLWLNLGDSYANNGLKDASKVGGFTGKRIRALRDGVKYNTGIMDSRPREIPAGLKPKDLIGIPWRVAFALQADGWYLRSEIIWAKPNPMPESVTDRPTKAHEQMFLLAKSQTYYYDADAIREACEAPAVSQRNSGMRSSELGTFGLTRGKSNPSCSHPLGRNKRTVWTVSSHPFPDAHFATFPPDLIKPCIFAGCPAGGVVLDPFLGAGTTALVAKENGRQCIGIELNAEYIKIAAKRLRQEVLDLQEATA